MSYAVCRMQKVKSAGLKGMQFHNQRERKSRTNDDIDHERTRENYDLKNDKNIDYNERVKEIIESQKTGTRKTRKDAVLVNELLVTSDRDFFEQLDPGEQKRFFEESYKLFSERYGKQNIAYATVHNDEQTPHMHLGVVPMRDGKLQGKNVFNRQELLWLQDKFPEHMKKQGFELKRGERGSDRKHIETAKFKKQTLEKEIDFLEKNLAVKNVYDGEELNKSLSDMAQGFRRMMQYKKINKNLVGFMRATEVTINNKDNSYNQHMHVLVCVEPTYFKNTENYVNQKQWIQFWKKAMKLDYDPNVKVQMIRPKNKYKSDIQSAIDETAKYPVKDTDFMTDDEEKNLKRLSDLEEGLHRKRLISYGGLLKEIHKKLNLDDTEEGDLIHTDDDEKADED